MSPIKQQHSFLDRVLRRIASWFFRLYGWLTQRLYHEFAWAYDLVSWVVSLGQWDAMRKLALDYIVGERILEPGFGTGELLLEMVKRGYQVTGLDSSPQMHRVTRRKLSRWKINAGLVRAETQKLPFNPDTFDTIVSTFPASYILDSETWVEFKRVIGEKGRVVVVGLVIWRSGKKSQSEDQATLSEILQQPLARCEQIARQSGLKVEVEYRRQKGWIVPVILAEPHR
jgi:ubiquinone/menaquinone biosynthesis C-methylase UbiE